MAADRLDVTFAALADLTRRAILTRLMRGEASVDGAGGTVRDEPTGNLEISEGVGAGRPGVAVNRER
jgi:hypothetical protein